MGYETCIDEDGKSETVYVKEEPDCTAPGCYDSGSVTNAAGEEQNCLECNPTEEQLAAWTKQAVADGLVDPWAVADGAPF